jgi:hypothetical protein
MQDAGDTKGPGQGAPQVHGSFKRLNWKKQFFVSSAHWFMARQGLEVRPFVDEKPLDGLVAVA